VGPTSSREQLLQAVGHHFLTQVGRLVGGAARAAAAAAGGRLCCLAPPAELCSKLTRRCMLPQHSVDEVSVLAMFARTARMQHLAALQ
jgi:hypothetical protein